MTGPYTAEISLNIDPALSGGSPPDLSLTWENNRDELAAGETTAWRFYRSGGGATLLGTLRAAVFYIAALLEPGESATVDLIGREVARGDDRAYAGGAYVRRDSDGRILSTLGSRWSQERHFRGI